MILWFRLQKKLQVAKVFSEGDHFLLLQQTSLCSYSSDSSSSWTFLKQCRNKYPLGNLLESFKFCELDFYSSLSFFCVLGFYKPDCLKQCKLY